MSTQQIELHATSITPLDPLPTTETRLAKREESVVAEVVEDESLPAAPSTTSALPSVAAFAGASATPFPEHVQATLRKFHTVPDDWISIRPEGHIYLTYSHAQDIFDEAFGFGGWAMVPVGDQFQVEKQDRHVMLYREYRLYCLGQFVRQAMGAGDYWTNNPAMNLSDAAEMCESYAMNRMAKRFRIASQCWDKTYADNWKRKYAYQDGDGKWKKKSGSGAGASAAVPPSQAAVPAAANESPASPQSRPAASVSTDAPATGKALSAILTPRTIGKVWAQGGYVLDDAGELWTFPTKHLPTAEQAIINGKQLKVVYKRNASKGKTFRNVDEAEVIA